MTIEDIEIKIKKYDREKNLVIVNIIIEKALEIRGFTVRYTTTKRSPTTPVWIVNPPAVKGRNKTYFWVVRFLESDFWQRLQEEITRQAREYANTII